MGKPGPNGSFPVARLQKERQKEGGKNGEKERVRDFNKKEREKERKKKKNTWLCLPVTEFV